MSKLRLCVDLDNVLGKTDAVMREVIRDFTKGQVQLRYEDVVKFDYSECKDRNGQSFEAQSWDEIHRLFSEARYLWLVQPMENVQVHLHTLSQRYEIHIATSRRPEARRVTVEWLESHQFPAHDLHFLRLGEKHISLGGFFAAVEDNYDQAKQFSVSGTPCYLMEHPWNYGLPHLERLSWVKNWDELTQVLLNI